ncbi:MAG TPA: amidohydrolase family protein [Caldilineaceae bacterium]|nr:amidohydrolase family protein [Caldilineaceae bacterium]
MIARADAHAHFFAPGYVDRLPQSCRRILPDEVTLYRAHAELHHIAQVLAVGYEGEAWASGNNRYLATLATQHGWLRPVAFVADPAALTESVLAEWREQGFVGISLYGETAVAALPAARPDVWTWLAERRWLISINLPIHHWQALTPVLERQPELRVLASHLGMPPAHATPPDLETARAQMEPLLALASFPGVHVKVSGFYALTEPGYAYPHRAAWPYVEAAALAFGPERLLWGSDFSPALEQVSFDQTVAVLDELPGFSAQERAQIAGANLTRLLNEIV